MFRKEKADNRFQNGIRSVFDIFGLQDQQYYPGVNLPYIPEMLVVGNSDIRGNRWYTSNYDTSPLGLPNIYAPGTGVLAAEGNVLFGDYPLREYTYGDGATHGILHFKSSNSIH